MTGRSPAQAGWRLQSRLDGVPPRTGDRCRLAPAILNVTAPLSAGVALVPLGAKGCPHVHAARSGPLPARRALPAALCRLRREWHAAVRVLRGRRDRPHAAALPTLWPLYGTGRP